MIGKKSFCSTSEEFHQKYTFIGPITAIEVQVSKCFRWQGISNSRRWRSFVSRPKPIVGYCEHKGRGNYFLIVDVKCATYKADLMCRLLQWTVFHHLGWSSPRLIIIIINWRSFLHISMSQSELRRVNPLPKLQWTMLDWVNRFYFEITAKSLWINRNCVRFSKDAVIFRMHFRSFPAL